MNWFDIIKGRGIGGGPPRDRKRKPRRGTTAPKGSYPDKINELIKKLTTGKITEAKYLEEKAKLQAERDSKWAKKNQLMKNF